MTTLSLEQASRVRQAFAEHIANLGRPALDVIERSLGGRMLRCPVDELLLVAEMLEEVERRKAVLAAEKSSQSGPEDMARQVRQALISYLPDAWCPAERREERKRFWRKISEALQSAQA